MATVNRKQTLTYNSARIHDSNEISMAIFHVFRLGTSLVLLLDPENIRPLEISSYRVYKLRYELCHIYFQLQAAIFEFSQIHTLNSPCSSLIMQPDPENMGIAIGISLLSCIRAEIYIYVISLCTFGQWPPSLISDIPGRRRIFPLVFLCCLTPKTCVQLLEFRCYHVYELRYV